RAQSEMDVTINKSRQQGSVAQVDKVPARRCLGSAGLDPRDLVTFNEDALIGQPTPALHVQQPPHVYHYSVYLLRSSRLRPGPASCDRNDRAERNNSRPDCYCSFVPHFPSPVARRYLK